MRAYPDLAQPAPGSTQLNLGPG